MSNEPGYVMHYSLSACDHCFVFACRKIFVGGVSWDTKKGLQYFVLLSSVFQYARH